jgi:hypothetical protein
VILTSTVTVTSIRCSTAEITSCVSAPNRRRGSRGVRGARLSRWSTTKGNAKWMPRSRVPWIGGGAKPPRVNVRGAA